MPSNYLIRILFFIFCANTQSYAKDLTYYHHQSEQIKSVLVKNKSPEPQDFWLLIYENQFVEEIYFEIEAKSQMTLSLKDFKKPGQQIALLSKSTHVEFPKTWNLNTSTQFENTKPIQNLKLLELTNLGLQSQDIKIKYFNFQKKLLFEETKKSLSYLQSSQIKLQTTEDVLFVSVQARWPIFIHPDSQLLPTYDPSLDSPGDKIQFLAEFEEGSQFIFTLDQPELISLAREEIANPAGLVVFGNISLNQSGLNKNPSVPHHPKWSWELNEVTALQHLAADWCQVYPEMLERMLSVILIQEKVCFRGSRIIGEITKP